MADQVPDDAYQALVDAEARAMHADHPNMAFADCVFWVVRLFDARRKDAARRLVRAARRSARGAPPPPTPIPRPKPAPPPLQPLGEALLAACACHTTTTRRGACGDA